MSIDHDDRPTPLILREGTTANLLERIPLGKPPFDEKCLQQLLAQHPEALPIAQLDAGFAPAICIGREILTGASTLAGAGKLDNIYVSRNGLITIVEAKLWKNPQARREVVGQIIDYTRQIVTWDFCELERRVKPYLKSTHAWNGTLFDWVAQQMDTPPDQQQFVDRVNDTLQHGRFLLLIVGDGIRTAVQEMVSYLQDTPQLQFRLALVEMGCYRIPGQDGTIVMVPQIVTKTAEVERAVVRIELTEDARKHLSVTTSVPSVPSSEAKTTPTEESFFSSLERSVGSDAAEQLRRFLQHITSEYDSLEKVVANQLMLTCKFTTAGGEYRIWLLSITQQGKVKLGGKKKWTDGKPLPKEVIESYWDSMGTICPSMKPIVPESGSVTTPSVPLAEFLERLDQVEPVIARYVTAIEDATTDD